MIDVPADQVDIADWEKAGLRRITLQEARHTAPTCLDTAGVPHKAASVLMGHATRHRLKPTPRLITLARYTRALPEDIELFGVRSPSFPGPLARQRRQRLWEAVGRDEPEIGPSGEP